MKIFIAVPTFESIFPDTYKSIYGLDPAGHRLVFDFVRGYDCAAARNRIAQQAGAEQADYVFMVDNDVVLPPTALRDLLDGPEDVCLGYYAHRDADNVYRGRTCLCRTHQSDGTLYFHYPTESEYTGAELRTMRDSGVNKILIHGGGMGCALIATRVFERLEYPYFAWVQYADGNCLSEDLYFCEQCRQRGIPIYADTRVGCGHVLRRVQWPE